MKHPKLKEVKKHFENAKTIRLVNSHVEIEVNPELFKKNKFGVNEYGSNGELLETKNSFHCVYGKSDRKYAEILTYKEKTFSITESQINSLKESLSLFGVNERLKEWFPEAYESEVKSLPKDFTGWVKTDKEKDGYWLMYFEKGIQKYGWDSVGLWTDYQDRNLIMEGDEREATEQEVLEALKNEAVKRGFIAGSWVKRPDCFVKQGTIKIYLTGSGFDLFGENNGKLQLNGSAIYEDGIWAEIIPTITL